MNRHLVTSRLAAANNAHLSQTSGRPGAKAGAIPKGVAMEPLHSAEHCVGITPAPHTSRAGLLHSTDHSVSSMGGNPRRSVSKPLHSEEHSVCSIGTPRRWDIPHWFCSCADHFRPQMHRAPAREGLLGIAKPNALRAM
jgi:hypothetical protein